MLKTSVLFTLIFAALAVPASASTNCGSERSQVGYRECLKIKASQSSVELEQALALLARRIDSWDEELEYRQRARAHLQLSFGRFQRFRDSQCELEASLAAGGNGAGDMRLHCEADLNKQYAKSLRSGLAHDPAPR
jgi:uncharacterized protein YecT (DUF1311 family)